MIVRNNQITIFCDYCDKVAIDQNDSDHDACFDCLLNEGLI